MTPLMIAALGALMVATAFLSGLFGMAGGMILIGVLLTIMPLPTAMVLHAVTQMASNGWRAFLWRAHIRWRPVFVYLIGCALALGLWSLTRYVPDKPVALLRIPQNIAKSVAGFCDIRGPALLHAYLRGVSAAWRILPISALAVAVNATPCARNLPTESR